MSTMSDKKTQLIEWLDKHLDDCPFDWYDGLNDVEIVFILEEGFVPHDTDDYGSKVDALVDSMGVTAEEESTTHRRRDLDSL